MRTAEHIILNLLTTYERDFNVHGDQKAFPSKRDITALSILRIASVYAHVFTGSSEVLSHIESCVSRISGSCLDDDDGSSLNFTPSSWILSEQLPFLAAKALISNESGMESVPFHLLSNHQSMVRYYCYNVVWFFRMSAPRNIVTDCLFQNIADTLGYVEQSVGLARAMYLTEEEFFLAAGEFSPPENFADQYNDRLEQIKAPGRLDAYTQLFQPLEIKVRQNVEEAALLTEWPKEGAVSRQLELRI